MSSPRSFSPSVSCYQPATLILWLSTAGAFLSFVTSQAVAAKEANGGNSRQLMAAAAQAEVDGDDARRITLLRTILQSDPENEAAHWQTGEIKVDGRWLSVGDAQQRSATSPLQAEYRQRRAAAGENVQDQIKLARWCRDNKLADEAQLHWAIVLQLSPTNKEALRATDCMLVDGTVVSRSVAAEFKRQSQANKDAAKYWESRMAKWRHAVGGRDLVAHDAALAEIRSINRLDAIPNFEAVTLGRDAVQDDTADECQQIAVAFLTALKKLPDHAATESIVRHAVLSPSKKVRSIAIEELRARDQHDYVPMLLAGMAMPIESSYQVITDPDGAVHYYHSLYREAADSDWAWDASYSMMRRSGFVVDIYIARPFAPREINVALSAERSLATPSPAFTRSAYASSAARLEAEIEATNNRIARINAQVMPVLATVTEKDFATAKQWWDWWVNANEYQKSEHPVKREGNSQTNGDCLCREGASCFLRGTPVWTKQGLLPIESVELGDFVLSQDINSGELTYKPVLARTVRPPSKMLSISLDGENISTTLGHPFWVAGSGWRMAKELGDGAQLHGVSGAKRLSAVKPAGEAEAYNLVVADNSTYFVGSSGLLVHDNTPRESAPVIIPGVSKE